jgi:trimethylamine--corrinoid protein Co-methyltransferase
MSSHSIDHFKTISLLDHASLEQIHKESLKILENVGVGVEDPECINILKKSGATVQGQSDIVRLPAEMVLEAIDQVTKEFELVSSDGTRYAMPSKRPMLMTRVKMSGMLDYGAEECRVPRRQDVINMCQIANALPAVKFSYAVDCPTADVPEEISIVDTVGLTFAITGNPGVCAPLSSEAGRAWIDISAAATGSDDLIRNPGVLIAMCTTGPLQFGRENGELIRHVATRGIPIGAEPMPMSGAVAPMTLAGTLLAGNAEVLFLLTLANAIRPGAKVSYSSLGTIMNLSIGNISMGAPETMLLCSAETAMARFYGLSTYRPTCFSDSYYPDVQAGIEKAAFTIMNILSGGDLILMGGSLNNAASQSYEQVIIDHDVWEFANRFVKEIVVNEDTLAYETIASVGPGGSFLAEDHTRRWLRSGEHYYGGSYNRNGRPGEENTMLARAHRRVEMILSQPLKFRAPHGAIERIKQYVRDEAKSAKVEIPPWAE